MRNALKTVVVGLILFTMRVGASKAATSQVPPPIHLGSDSEQVPANPETGSGLVPSRLDNPLEVVADHSNDMATPRQASVEAIPTPTAFHAGGALLLLIIAGRFVRRLRLA